MGHDDDATLEQVTAEAIARYRAWLTEDEAAAATEMLADALATHPVTGELLDQLAPRPEQQASGTVAKDDAGVEAEVKEKASGSE